MTGRLRRTLTAATLGLLALLVGCGHVEKAPPDPWPRCW